MNFSQTHTRLAELEIFQHPISFTACDRHGTVHCRRYVSSLMYDVQKKKTLNIKSERMCGAEQSI